MSTQPTNTSRHTARSRLGKMRLSQHVSIRHNATSRVVTIEMTEDAVIGCYLSSCAFLIGGLIAGCTVYKRQQSQRNVDPCACASCRGQYVYRRELGTGGYGRANVRSCPRAPVLPSLTEPRSCWPQLVVRQGKPYVLKMVGCDSINEANAALTEAACLQRLNHPNVVRFEDVFLHRHDNGGCSVSIVMEFCAGGDLIDRIECPKKPLSELSMLRFLESLCHALHHVHCGGVLHRDLKSSNIFVGRHDREVKVRAIGTLGARLRTLTSSCSPRLPAPRHAFRIARSSAILGSPRLVSRPAASPARRGACRDAARPCTCRPRSLIANHTGRRPTRTASAACC